MSDYPVKDGAGNTIIASANTSGYGATGVDYSSAKPALLGTILATIPANPSRNFAEVQNQSAAQIQVVLYDSVGAGYGVLYLAPGGAATQGADWTSANFKGKVEVRGAGGEQVYIHEE